MHVRTTLTIDDDVYRAVTSLAASAGTTIGKVLSGLARRALAPAARIREEGGFPVFDVPANAPLITMEMVRDAEDR